MGIFNFFIIEHFFNCGKNIFVQNRWYLLILVNYNPRILTKKHVIIPSISSEPISFTFDVFFSQINQQLWEWYILWKLSFHPLKGQLVVSWFLLLNPYRIQGTGTNPWVTNGIFSYLHVYHKTQRNSCREIYVPWILWILWPLPC